MTDKQKLQELFDAALKSPTDFAKGVPTRKVPTPVFDEVRVPEVETASQPMTARTGTCVAVRESGTPAASAPTDMATVLDDAASAELGRLLDEQLKQKVRKRKMETLVAALVMFGLTGGGFAWFVHSPERVQAFHEALRDMRSAGDIQSMVAKYQASLDRMSARSMQIDQTTTAMGVKKTAADEKDPYLEAEMKEIMDGEGKTVGERNRLLQKKFGDEQKKNAIESRMPVDLKDSDSFSY